MRRKEKPKKSINEFYTARENGNQAINLITSGYRFSKQGEDHRIKYFSNTMNKSEKKQDTDYFIDKYKILAGKLHVFNSASEKYFPVKNNNHIDIPKLFSRIQNDSAIGKRRLKIGSPTGFNLGKDLVDIENAKLPETSKTSKNGLGLTTQSWKMRKTKSEVFNERPVRTSYKNSRL